ncbi:MAG: HNH endonuclease [Muribaculaceae bacterium]|nr:HNH endonuclease [Muribaculaceae bacterium]
MASVFERMKALYPENWHFIARKYKEKKNFTCEKCGVKYPPQSKWLHVHHIVPLTKGGTSDEINLQLLCYKCHKALHPHMGKKGPRTTYSKPFD